MTTRDDLEGIAATRRDLPRLQGEAIANARAEGMTWREIAAALGVTERGAIKTQRAWEQRQHRGDA